MLRFVINLDRSIDRWMSISGNLAKLGIAAERVAGVDGRLMSNEECQKLQPNLRSKWEFPREISKGEIGCYLSHIKCWESLRDSDEEWALIMEDDIAFSDRAIFYFTNQDWIPKGVDLVQPFIVEKRWRAKVEKSKIQLENGDRLLHPLKPYPVCTLAYFINRTTAIDALENSKKLAMPVDEFLFGPMSSWAKKHPVWRLNPAVVCGQEFESTIGSERRKLYMRSSMMAKYNPIRHIRKIKNSLHHILNSDVEDFEFK